LAHSSRGWTGARTPSSLKNVRQSARRRAVNQPRRTAAKTLINAAVVAASNGEDQAAVASALARAISALDRAAKSGAIHRNAADRRKSRLVLKVNAALGGEELPTAGKVARSTGKAAAQKQAKARIAASKSVKAKGAQTAAGKARAALARTTRESGPGSASEAEAPTAKAPTAPKASSTARSAAKPAKAVKAAKPSAAKPAAKPKATRSSSKSS
jgi:ribosomal protein S20